jgi:prepilin-type processing-associated H-X9-DG protein
MNESPASPPPLPAGASAPRTSGLAIASLVLGILSLFLMIFTSIPAIICGIAALIRISNSRGRLTGKGLAISGIVVGVLFTLVLPAILLPALARAREAARRASCQNNLKQMGLVFKLYANESKGRYYPELSSEPGNLMFSAREVYPNYLPELSTYICPSDAERDAHQARMNPDPDMVFDDQSYVYFGYVITNDDELEAFAEVYRERVAQGLPFDEDLKAPPGRGSMGRNTFYRLREGVELFFVTDINDLEACARIQSMIPVMWDRVGSQPGVLTFNHMPGGANVLYMDGHVEFEIYPDSWPVTRGTPELFSELEALGR